MKKRILALAVVCLIFVGCAPRYPVTNVSTIDSRPTLSFLNAPEGSIVLVDNLNVGEASKFTGSPKVLVVEPGTHEVVIMKNNQVIFKQAVFVESEHKVINVH